MEKEILLLGKKENTLLFVTRKMFYQIGTLFIGVALLMAGFNAPSAKAQSATALSGWFTIRWGDSINGSTSFQEYHFDTDDGKSVRLSMDESNAQPWDGIPALNRKRVTVQGTWASNTIAPAFQATSISPEKSDLTAQSNMTAEAVTGAQPWVTIMCYF
jgi:hypothetical protein